ncbi:Phosphatidylserine decarboxylase proenzyme [uncultured Gammaproteobacteria bacterium]
MRHLDCLKVTIHPEGWRFVAIFAAVTAVISFFFHGFLWVGGIATLWCAYFFRDPPRVTPTRPGLLVSPADGKVLMITTAPPPFELGMGKAPLTKVSIFLNVFDVHINRAPIAGVVEGLTYRPGKFLNAAHDKASTDNEALALRLRIADGQVIGLVQIAGLVARRIVSFVREGYQLEAGQRYGLIRFGSRVDVYLPNGVAPLVIEGQSMLGGETILADLASAEPARQGKIQ